MEGSWSTFESQFFLDNVDCSKEIENGVNLLTLRFASSVDGQLFFSEKQSVKSGRGRVIHIPAAPYF